MNRRSCAALAGLILGMAGGTCSRADVPPGGADRRWEDEIVYVCIQQKFFNGDPANDLMARKYIGDRQRLEGGFWGGDLAGVIQKLDDLAQLGITTLMLYPVIQNDESAIGRFLPTGYRPKDYFHVDRNFGSLKTLQELVAEAHARGIRVLLDLPLGMPGFEHPFVTDRAHRDWFGMPTQYGTRRWKVERPEVADYLISIGKFWREQTGCDGFRLDSAQLHPDEFWQRFIREVKADGDRPPGVSAPLKEFIILAELVKHPREIGLAQQTVGFDSCYDFSAGTLRDVIGKESRTGMLSFVFREAQQFYPAPRSLVAQIDNYEDPAFITAALNPKIPRLHAALTMLLTIDRVPLIFCGDELGLFSYEVGACFAPDRAENETLGRLQRVITVRKEHPALRRGAYEEIACPAGVFGFLRSLDQETILVLLNVTPESVPVAPDLPGKPWNTVSLDDLLERKLVHETGSSTPLEVPGFSALVLQVRPAN